MNIGLYKFQDKSNNYISFKESTISNKKQLSFGNEIYNYPDLKQNDEYSCGPISAANSIIWLRNNGFPNLCTSNHSSALVDELSKSVKLIKSENKGTSSNNMCTGLENFINSKGYKISKLEYQGIRPVDNKYKTSMIPDIEKIKREIKKDNVILLNLGIYNKKNTHYERQYGHWVTVTGSGDNGYIADNNYLTIHDPYSKVNGNFYIKPIKIERGKFFHNSDDNEKTLTDNASGFYEISQKFNYFRNSEVGVIDGAVILEMNKPSNL